MNLLQLKCLLWIVPFVLLTACGGDDDAGSSKSSNSKNSNPATPKAQLAALENSGAIPKLDRSDSIAGPDTNNNGIRDDIDAYIAEQYPVKEQGQAAAQLARALQASLFVGADRAAAKRVSLRVHHGIHCVHTRFPSEKGGKDPSRVVREIEAMTANTKNRSLAYLAYNEALDGTVSSLPRGDTCE